MGVTERRGFSVLEAVIAMSVWALAAAALLAVVWSAQAGMVDARIRAHARGLARELLQQAMQDAHRDFRLVNPRPEAPVPGTPFHVSLEVRSTDDFFVKRATAAARWNVSSGISQRAEISGLLADVEDAVGGDTCDSMLAGGWNPPRAQTYGFVPGGLLPGGTPGSYLITDLDAYRNRLYVTVNNAPITASSPSLHTLFIFDIASDSAPPAYLGSVDNNPTDSAGLNAVAVAEDPATGRVYAYAANGYGANFTSCAQGSRCAQLQIFDVTEPHSPMLVANVKAPGVTGSAGQGIGKSIVYSRGYVYLGLAKAASGGELHIVDVHNPAAPRAVPGGMFAAGNGINAIFVKRGYAFLATPNSSELTVLHIADPSAPVVVGTYDAPDSAGNGKIIDAVGTTLYLGRTVTAANHELFVLDIADPSRLQERNQLPRSVEIGSSVIGLKVRHNLAFTVSTKQSIRAGKIQVWLLDDPSGITELFSIRLPDTGGAALNTGSGAALDCERNSVYAASVDASHAAFITAISGLR